MTFSIDQSFEQDAPGLFVMKCGGSTLAELPDSFFDDLAELQQSGAKPVILHGGGPAISENLSRLGIESRFVGGLRVTTEAVLDVVEMTLAGSLNKAIVRRIQRHGAQALGLSGTDGRLLTARPVANSAEVGLVGQVTEVNAALIRSIAGMGYIPVIAPVGIGEDGTRYNINADTAAGAVASAIRSPRMIVVTDVPGVLGTVNGVKAVLPAVTPETIEAMIASGEIYGGMIPKVRAALDCLQGEVAEVIIADGKEPRVLSRIVNGELLGTRIVKESRYV
ncbi:acetylglutamate kinase [Paenibacillus sp. CN-4]|uniref:acetylglutamate kinase n=1 Tax=Paenibacillus nanchangensis TaxID=3348343 RepID=UPI0039786740